MVNPKLVYCKFFASHLKYRRDAEHRCCSRLERLSTEGRMMLFGEFRIQGTQNRFLSFDVCRILLYRKERLNI